LLPISRGVTVENVFSLADGRLIVAGRQLQTTDGAGRPYLLRLTPTGAVDSTYPSMPLAQNFRFADNIDQFAIDGQERILISRQSAPHEQPTLTRLTNAGEIDTSFGSGGSVVVPLKDMTAMAVAADGDVFVAGIYKTTTKDNGDVESFTGLVALKNDGSIDTSVGSRGIIPTGSTVDHTSSSRTTITYAVFNDRILFDSTGNIIEARDLQKLESFNDANGEFESATVVNAVQVFRFGADGTADANFSFDRTHLIDPRNAILAGVTLNSDDTLQVEYLDLVTSKNRQIQRYGQWISTVSNDGTLTDNVIVDNTLTNADTRSKAVKEADGLLLFETDGQTIVRYRYQSDGVVDSSFTQDPSVISSNDDLQTLQITDDGQILASYFEANLSGGLNGAFLVKLQQSDAPTGVVVAKPITHDESTGYYFTVTWQDDDNVDFSSLSNDDIIVVLPDGSKKSATFISADPSSDAKVITARYRFTSPDGFTTADAGQYKVRVRGRAVADTSGNHAAAREIGRFNVTIPLDAHIA
jgi:hypothetical protein